MSRSARSDSQPIHSNSQVRSVPELWYRSRMMVAREHYADLIARAFDGAVVVDGMRIVAHKSGTHLVRIDVSEAERQRRAWEAVDRRGLDRDNDWSDV